MKKDCNEDTYRSFWRQKHFKSSFVTARYDHKNTPLREYIKRTDIIILNIIFSFNNYKIKGQKSIKQFNPDTENYQYFNDDALSYKDVYISFSGKKSEQILLQIILEIAVYKLNLLTPKNVYKCTKAF